MKDKAFILYEIIKKIHTVGEFFRAGDKFMKMKEHVAKEIGVSLIWRGYRYNKAKVKEALIKAADHSNWEVREYAAGAFINTLIHNPDFYNTLMKWTKHKSENVRRAVVMSAIGLRQKENLRKAFSLLQPLLFDSSSYVKRNLGPFVLGSYFGTKFSDEIFKQLDKWLKLKNPNVRWNIAMSFRSSFGKKHPNQALRYLKQLSKDENKVVKHAVKSVLAFLGKRK